MTSSDPEASLPGLDAALAGSYAAEDTARQAALHSGLAAVRRIGEQFAASRAVLRAEAAAAAHPPPGKPVEYVGITAVAGWCEVAYATACGWLTRYPQRDAGHPNGWPAPDAIARPGRRGPDRLWLPTRRHEWQQWAKTKGPGRGHRTDRHPQERPQ